MVRVQVMDAVYEIMIHGVRQRCDFSGIAAVLRRLDVGIAHRIGNLGREPSLYGCPGDERRKNDHGRLHLSERVSSLYGHSAAQETASHERTLIIDVAVPHHLQQRLLGAVDLHNPLNINYRYQFNADPRLHGKLQICR